MTQHRNRDHGQPVPANLFDAWQEFVTAGAWNLRLVKASATSIAVKSWTGNDPDAAINQVSVGIGRWAYRRTALNAAVPGALPTGRHNVWATGTVLDATAEDNGTFDYAFGLRLMQTGQTPGSLGASEALYRLLGTFDWDATAGAITGIQQLVGGVPIPDLGVGTLQLGDGAVTDGKLSADTLAGMPEIGEVVPFAGSADPAGGRSLLADGRLVRQADYPLAFARMGHVFNLGVPPGNDGGGFAQFRIPDLRGRSAVGVPNMGTAQGSGGSGNDRAQAARGSVGGEVNHQLTTAEVPDMTAVIQVSQTQAGGANGALAMMGSVVSPFQALNLPIDNGGGSHNNLMPYQAMHWLVRMK